MRLKTKYYWVFMFLFLLFNGKFAFCENGKQAGVELEKSIHGDYTIHFKVKNFRSNEVEIQQKKFANYSYDGAFVTYTGGEPVVPFTRINLAIPPNKIPVVSWEMVNNVIKSGLPPAIAPEISHNEDGSVNEKWTIPVNYQNKALRIPLVHTSGVQVMRFQRYVSLTVYPVSYLGDNQVQVFDELQITIQWQDSPDPNNYEFSPADPMAEHLYDTYLINEDDAKSWRTRPLVDPEDVIFSNSANWLKVKIKDHYDENKHIHQNRNGIYKITGSDLANLVAGSQIDMSSIRIFANGGQNLPYDLTDVPQSYHEIPIYVSKATGVMNSNDYLLFYGVAQNGYYDEFSDFGNRDFYENPYANENCYWITWNGSFIDPPRRISIRQTTNIPGLAPQPSFIEKIHVEDNLDWVYAQHLPDDDWLWDFLVGRGTIGGDNYYFQHEIIDPIQQNPAVDFTIAMRRKDARGVVKLYLNDTEFGSHIWLQGYSDYIQTFNNVTAREGSNTLNVQMIGSSSGNPDQAYLGWYEVLYSRKFKAKDEYLKFRTPSLTSTAAAYQITNFSSDQVLVWDVTNHLNPFAISASIQSESGKFTASFQDSVNAQRPYLYYAVSNDGFFEVDDISRVNFQDTFLHSPLNEIDYLIIAPIQYHDELETFAEFREERLAEYLTTHTEGITDPVVKIIDSQRVYDEFSGGYLDPAGIRNFLRYTYENWARTPLYVLFVSDANIDYRNYRRSNDPIINYVPTFQWPANNDWATDDWFVWFNADRDADMVNGRFPVKNELELEAVIEKVITYETEPVLDHWQNTVIAVADDYKQPSGFSPHQIYFTTNEDEINRDMLPNNFDTNEIFLVEYEFDANGFTKIKAHEDLLEATNKGAIMVRYTGHGGSLKMADENVFNYDDVPVISVNPKQALWGSFSCDVANFDHYSKECIAEAMFVVANKGSIGFVAGIRSTYGGPNRTLEQSWVDHLFNKQRKTMGEALFLAKLSAGNDTNNSKYVLFGDPAQEIAQPEFKILFDNESFSAAQGDTITISGQITDGDTTLENFNGFAYINVFSNKIIVNYVDAGHNVTATWDHTGTPIFRGTTIVTNGRFSQTVYIPSNVGLGNEGRISIYAWDEANGLDAAAANDSLQIVTGIAHVSDAGPSIQVFIDDYQLVDNGAIYPRSTLEIKLEDEQGINLTGMAEAGILLEIIELRQNLDDPVNVIFQADLTSHFEYALGQYQVGSLQWQIPELNEGFYTLRIRAVDNLNNANYVSYNIEIRSFVGSNRLQVYEVINYPNPTRGDTHFLFKVNRDMTETEIKIFTVAGRLIRTLGPEITAGSGLQNQIYWDGKDEDGDSIANGVYLYKITAIDRNIEPTERKSVYNKLMIYR